MESPLLPRRYFTVAEANELLPVLRPIVEAMSQLATDLIDRRERLHELNAYRGKSFGPYRDELIAMLEELETDARRLRDFVEQLASYGVETKGVVDGIVDFPFLTSEGEVLLCWKLGEPEVLFWHDTTAGFAGRRPVAELPPPKLTDPEL